MDDLRAKVTSSRSWPVAGSFSKDRITLFTPFQRLPQEIRARIYELASYQPRTIEVTCHAKPLSDTPAPALLHASSESRMIALKVYEPLILNEVETGTFVNWDFDTIFVNDRRALFNRQQTYTVLAEKCKKLALVHASYAPFRLPAEYTNVESLIIVLQIASDDGNIEFVPCQPGEQAMWGANQECERLWNDRRIKYYIVRDAARGFVRKMSPKEKVTARDRREQERKKIEPLRSDEDVAIRLQYDLDHGLL